MKVGNITSLVDSWFLPLFRENRCQLLWLFKSHLLAFAHRFVCCCFFSPAILRSTSRECIWYQTDNGTTLFRTRCWYLFMSLDLTTCNVIQTVNTIQDVLRQVSVHELYFSWYKWICVRVRKSLFLLLLRSCDKSLWCPSVHWGVQAQSRDGTSENTRRSSALLIGDAIGYLTSGDGRRVNGIHWTCVVDSAGFGSGDDVLPRGRHRQCHRHFQTNHRALPVWTGLCHLSEADWTRLVPFDLSTFCAINDTFSC